MYNKTNVNSKCSMRVIKGCTGTAAAVQSTPELVPACPGTSHSPFRTQRDGPWKRKQKRSKDVVELKDGEGWREAARLPHPESEAPGGGDSTEARPVCAPSQRLLPRGAQTGIVLLWEASPWNGSCLSKIRRCRKCSLIQ